MLGPLKAVGQVHHFHLPFGNAAHNLVRVGTWDCVVIHLRPAYCLQCLGRQVWRALFVLLQAFAGEMLEEREGMLTFAERYQTQTEQQM